MAKEIQKTENKADVIPYVIAAEVGAPLIGAAATPNGEHPYIDGRTIVVAQGVITEIKGELTEKVIAGKDAEIERLSTLKPPRSSQTERARQFLVVQDYCGIAKGDTVMSDNIGTINHMLKNGYWKEV